MRTQGMRGGRPIFLIGGGLGSRGGGFHGALAALDADPILKQLAIQGDAIDAQGLGRAQLDSARAIQGMRDQHPLGVLEQAIDIRSAGIGPGSWTNVVSPRSRATSRNFRPM